MKVYYGILSFCVLKGNEEFKCKIDISIFINLRLKLLKNKENNKKICDIFHRSFKNIPYYVTSEVSLNRFYFALFDDGHTLKTLKLAYIVFLHTNSSNWKQQDTHKLLLHTYPHNTHVKVKRHTRGPWGAVASGSQECGCTQCKFRL